MLNFCPILPIFPRGELLDELHPGVVIIDVTMSIMLLELLTIGVLGLIIGSFLNVFILRLNTGRSTTGRSGCMSCGEKLSWMELVPVLSFFLLKGRCKSCGSKISNQYWIVELATAALFILVWMQNFPLLHLVFALILVSLLIVIAVYDLKHTIIPNKIVYTFIGIALLSNIPVFGTASLEAILVNFVLVLVSGVLVAAPLFILWLVSKGRWMGFGDIKLTFGFGLILGVYGGLTAIMLGFIFGAVIGLFLLYIPKVIKYVSLSLTSSRFTMSSEIPFAPFLIAGFFLVFLFDIDILQLMGTLI